MEVIWTKEIDEILSVGLPLHSIGVSNWALNKKQALIVLDIFLEKNIPVLGGDVYEKINGGIQSNYDSWYCDLSEQEKQSDFLRRSLLKARDYINDYKQDKDIFFVFVPGIPT